MCVCIYDACMCLHSGNTEYINYSLFPGSAYFKWIEMWVSIQHINKKNNITFGKLLKMLYNIHGAANNVTDRATVYNELWNGGLMRELIAVGYILIVFHIAWRSLWIIVLFSFLLPFPFGSMSLMSLCFRYFLRTQKNL